MTCLRFLSLFSLFITAFSLPIFSQPVDKPELSVQWIMRNPTWMGSFPDQIRWSENSQEIYFNWNDDKAPADSIYKVGIESDDSPEKMTLEERKALSGNGSWNSDHTQKVYEKNGDLFLFHLENGQTEQITNTIERESAPVYAMTDLDILFRKKNNIYRWSRKNGLTEQLTDFRPGNQPPSGRMPLNEQKKWLSEQELELMEVLNQRKENREASREQRKLVKPDRPLTYYFGKKQLESMNISPDGRFVVVRFMTPAQGVEITSVPHYIQESGYTDELMAYPKVGSPLPEYETFIYNIHKKSIYEVNPNTLPGIRRQPEFLAESGFDNQKTRSIDGNPQTISEDTEPKPVLIIGPRWSSSGLHAVVEVRSQDFKDRWIASLDLNTGQLRNLDHQHNEAWIGGPDIPWWTNGSAGEGGWIPNENKYWYKSEKDGYSHLYVVDVSSGNKEQLTKGKFEVFSPQISKDKKFWYFTSSEVHPGERHFYKMPINGGEAIQLTSMTGNNEVSLSPDEKWLAIRYSNGNTPWELYLQPNRKGGKPRQITDSQSEEFKSYPWRKPENITFTARDGASVHARLYRPEGTSENGPAVIFVHGAGYLQNAHKWWSNYFREYMFHNLLADKGYTVLDIDYRASAGYGRDWRTAIYRHMGGLDLSDQVDGAQYLVEELGVDKDRLGIYGGSYGGFITLMAMFTQPDVFKAGAALRPVTDWAHYHHQYTAGILNSPQDDSLAYIRSSPIYHAEGLKGALLICHGMIDTNVHFQDVVRLNQRLIELGKENWQVAIYPMEGHGFREASSWTDEYRRILKLFEENLK